MVWIYLEGRFEEAMPPDVQLTSEGIGGRLKQVVQSGRKGTGAGDISQGLPPWASGAAEAGGWQ